MDRLVAWLERSDVDVLAIQETKIPDEKFPVDRFAELGYQVAHHGTNQWNGVAVLSRVGLTDIQVGVPGLPSFGDPAVTEAGRSVRCAAASGCGACTSRTVGPSAIRTTTTSWNGSRPSATTARRSWPPTRRHRSRCAVTSTSRRPTTTSGVSSTTGTPPTSPRRSGRPSTTWSTAGFTDVVRPTHPRSGRLHLLGLHPAGFPEAARHADRLRPGQSGARRPGHRCADRPRGTQGQVAVRPRAGHRRIGGLTCPTTTVQILVIEHDPSDPVLRLGDWLTEAGGGADGLPTARR